mmetsp:Transcript_20028/g.28949  ORF Transcript_20028/g.28949 Transcript_20028/m.28949 type:complete len:200 (-) Transcript_20028:332-931(-)
MCAPIQLIQRIHIQHFGKNMLYCKISHIKAVLPERLLLLNRDMHYRFNDKWRPSKAISTSMPSDSFKTFSSLLWSSWTNPLPNPVSRVCLGRRCLTRARAQPRLKWVGWGLSPGLKASTTSRSIPPPLSAGGLTAAPGSSSAPVNPVPSGAASSSREAGGFRPARPSRNLMECSGIRLTSEMYTIVPGPGPFIQKASES